MNDQEGSQLETCSLAAVQRLCPDLIIDRGAALFRTNESGRQELMSL
jgi:hypothetical protein